MAAMVMLGLLQLFLSKAVSEPSAPGTLPLLQKEEIRTFSVQNGLDAGKMEEMYAQMAGTKDKKMAELQAEVLRLTAELADCKSGGTRHASEIKTLQDQIETLRDQLAAQAAAVAAAAACKTDLTECQGELKECQEENKKLKGDIASRDTLIAQATAAIKVIQTELDALKITNQTCQDALKTSQAALTAALAGKGGDTAAIQAELAKAKADLAELQKASDAALAASAAALAKSNAELVIARGAASKDPAADSICLARLLNDILGPTRNPAVTVDCDAAHKVLTGMRGGDELMSVSEYLESSLKHIRDIQKKGFVIVENKDKDKNLKHVIIDLNMQDSAYNMNFGTMRNCSIAQDKATFVKLLDGSIEGNDMIKHFRKAGGVVIEVDGANMKVKGNGPEVTVVADKKDGFKVGSDTMSRSLTEMVGCLLDARSCPASGASGSDDACYKELLETILEKQEASVQASCDKAKEVLKEMRNGNDTDSVETHLNKAKEDIAKLGKEGFLSVGGTEYIIVDPTQIGKLKHVTQLSLVRDQADLKAMLTGQGIDDIEKKPFFKAGTKYTVSFAKGSGFSLTDMTDPDSVRYQVSVTELVNVFLASDATVDDAAAENAILKSDLLALQQQFNVLKKLVGDLPPKGKTGGGADDDAKAAATKANDEFITSIKAFKEKHGIALFGLTDIIEEGDDVMKNSTHIISREVLGSPEAVDEHPITRLLLLTEDIMIENEHRKKQVEEYRQYQRNSLLYKKNNVHTRKGEHRFWKEKDESWLAYIKSLEEQFSKCGDKIPDGIAGIDDDHTALQALVKLATETLLAVQGLKCEGVDFGPITAKLDKLVSAIGALGAKLDGIAPAVNAAKDEIVAAIGRIPTAGQPLDTKVFTDAITAGFAALEARAPAPTPDGPSPVGLLPASTTVADCVAMMEAMRGLLALQEQKQPAGQALVDPNETIRKLTESNESCNTSLVDALRAVLENKVTPAAVNEQVQNAQLQELRTDLATLAGNNKTLADIIKDDRLKPYELINKILEKQSDKSDWPEIFKNAMADIRGAIQETGKHDVEMVEALMKKAAEAAAPLQQQPASDAYNAISEALKAMVLRDGQHQTSLEGILKAMADLNGKQTIPYEQMLDIQRQALAAVLEPMLKSNAQLVDVIALLRQSPAPASPVAPFDQNAFIQDMCKKLGDTLGNAVKQKLDELKPTSGDKTELEILRAIQTTVQAQLELMRVVPQQQQQQQAQPASDGAVARALEKVSEAMVKIAESKSAPNVFQVQHNTYGAGRSAAIADGAALNVEAARAILAMNQASLQAVKQGLTGATGATGAAGATGPAGAAGTDGKPDASATEAIKSMEAQMGKISKLTGELDAEVGLVKQAAVYEAKMAEKRDENFNARIDGNAKSIEDKLAFSVAKFQDGLARLEAAVQNGDAKDDALQADLGGLREKLIEELGDIKTELATLKAAQENAGEQLNLKLENMKGLNENALLKMQAEIAKDRVAEIGKVLDKVKDIDVDMTGLKATVEALKTSDARNNNSIKELSSALDTKLGELYGKLDAVAKNARGDNQALEARVDADVAALDNKVEAGQKEAAKALSDDLKAAEQRVKDDADRRYAELAKEFEGRLQALDKQVVERITAASKLQEAANTLQAAENAKDLGNVKSALEKEIQAQKNLNNAQNVRILELTETVKDALSAHSESIKELQDGKVPTEGRLSTLEATLAALEKQADKERVRSDRLLEGLQSRMFDMPVLFLESIKGFMPDYMTQVDALLKIIADAMNKPAGAALPGTPAIMVAPGAFIMSPSGAPGVPCPPVEFPQEFYTLMRELIAAYKGHCGPPPNNDDCKKQLVALNLRIEELREQFTKKQPVPDLVVEEARCEEVRVIIRASIENVKAVSGQFATGEFQPEAAVEYVTEGCDKDILIGLVTAAKQQVENERGYLMKIVEKLVKGDDGKQALLEARIAELKLIIEGLEGKNAGLQGLLQDILSALNEKAKSCVPAILVAVDENTAGEFIKTRLNCGATPIGGDVVPQPILAAFENCGGRPVTVDDVASLIKTICDQLAELKGYRVCDVTLSLDDITTFKTELEKRCAEGKKFKPFKVCDDTIELASLEDVAIQQFQATVQQLCTEKKDLAAKLTQISITFC